MSSLHYSFFLFCLVSLGLFLCFLMLFLVCTLAFRFDALLLVCTLLRFCVWSLRIAFQTRLKKSVTQKAKYTPGIMQGICNEKPKMLNRKVGQGDRHRDTRTKQTKITKTRGWAKDRNRQEAINRTQVWTKKGGKRTKGGNETQSVTLPI